MEVLNDPERGQDTVKLAWPTAVEIEATYEDELPNSTEPLHRILLLQRLRKLWKG